jgi:D-arginine dehydrogenase
MERFDVAVIGGGIAGASAAFELARHGSVVLLEQEATCGHHSTGRSAAVFTECYGDAVVRRLAMASRTFLEQPPGGFADAAILSPRPLMFVGARDRTGALDTTHAEFAELVPDARRLDAAEAIDLCPVLDPAVVAGGVLEPEARDLDVHALHLGYQRGMRERGGTLRTSAGVGALRRTGAGWEIDAGGTTLRVDTVVNAAGAWADVVGVMAGVEPVGLVPKRRTAFTFEPPDAADATAWPMVIDIDERWYFKPEGPHLLASPADETPMEPHDVRHSEEDVALAIDRIQGATTMSIRSIQHAWAGLRSFVADKRPVNGWAPDAPGFYWLAGQGGYGIKTSPAMAAFAAGMISGEGLPDRITDLGLTIEHLSPARLG